MTLGARAKRADYSVSRQPSSCRKRIERRIAGLGSVVVAFSGGVRFIAGRRARRPFAWPPRDGRDGRLPRPRRR